MTARFTRRQLAISSGLALALAKLRQASAAAEPYVVDAAWLQARLASDPNVVILDVSSLGDYHDAHVKSAVHCWWQDTMEWNDPVYGTTLTTGGTPARRQVLQDLGIDDGTMVVAYDSSANHWAARMVWYLRWLSHPGAALLDGGLDAWRSAGGAVQSGSNAPAKRGKPSISAQSSSMLDTSRLQSRLKAGGIQLVDVRTADEMKDDANGASKLGRIPGSISFPWTNLSANGRLKPQDELRQAMAAVGIVPDKPVVVYARYGVEADFPWVVLKWLGYPDVAVYDDGFVGWQTNSSRPIEPLPAS